MNDLIRRDAVIDVLLLEFPQINIPLVQIALERVSAVDAVEVVRCSQCINNPRIGTKTKGMVWCRKFRSEVRPDDFCSYGERREENEHNTDDR